MRANMSTHWQRRKRVAAVLMLLCIAFAEVKSVALLQRPSP